MTNFYQTKLTDQETCQINKYIKKKNYCWKLPYLERTTTNIIFEFRFRKHKIKLCVHRVKMYIHNGCSAIYTIQYMSHLCHNKLCVCFGFCPWKHLKLTTIDKFAKIGVNAQATMGLQDVFLY
jgi:hypothetical protein